MQKSMIPEATQGTDHGGRPLGSQRTSDRQGDARDSQTPVQVLVVTKLPDAGLVCRMPPGRSENGEHGQLDHFVSLI